MMPVRFQRPYSYAAAWSGRTGFFAVALFALGALVHRLDTLETPSFIAIALVAVALAVVSLVLAIMGLSSLWLFGAKGGRAAFWGLLFSLVLIVPFGFAAFRYIDLPPLDDISTDLVAVPRFLAEPEVDGSWLSPAEAVAEQAAAPAAEPQTAPESAPDAEPAPPASRMAQRAAYPQLSGRRYEGAIDRVLAAVQVVAAARGMTITETEGVVLAPPEPEPEPLPDTPEIADGTPPPPPDLDTLDAPVPSPAPRGEEMAVAPPSPRVLLQGEMEFPILALESDVVIRLIEEEETTFVDMRSASRYGDHDLGLNAWQIERFFNALDAELLGVAAE